MLAELPALGVAHGHARTRGIAGVGAAIIGGAGLLEAVVGVDLVLELGGDLPIIVEGRAVLGRLLVRCDHYGLARVVDRGHLERDQGGAGPEEAHLYAYVLGLVVLVDEQVVDLADLLVGVVVDGVACEAVLYRREPIATLLVIHALPPSLRAYNIASRSLLTTCYTVLPLKNRP